MRIAQVFPLPPGRVDVKNRYFPSGDQRAALLSVLGDVKRCGSPPAVGTTQISLCRLFSASRTVVTVTATRSPAGDMAGALSVVSRYQSRSWKARLGAACCANAVETHSGAMTARKRVSRMQGCPAEVGKRGRASAAFS